VSRGALGAVGISVAIRFGCDGVLCGGGNDNENVSRCAISGQDLRSARSYIWRSVTWTHSAGMVLTVCERASRLSSSRYSASLRISETPVLVIRVQPHNAKRFSREREEAMIFSISSSTKGELWPQSQDARYSLCTYPSNDS
jgi:hypothetical protein